MASTSISKSEKSYIQTSLQASPPLRADGRGLHQYRPIALETGVAPLANGSARLRLGQTTDSSGGTEILAGVKLEVQETEGTEGRIICSVSCSPSAYPHISGPAIEDIAHDYTAVLHEVLSHTSLLPPSLRILPGRKAWLLSLDLLVVSDSGNVYDALFMAAQAALWDTKVPRTRAVEYRSQGGLSGGKEGGDMDVDAASQSGFNVRAERAVADFELEDYWDEGEPLAGRDQWPVCVALNLLPPMYYLDATSAEEAATPLRLLLMYSAPAHATPRLQGMRLLGSGEVNLGLIKSLTSSAQPYAVELAGALRGKLKDEDLRRTDKARHKFGATR
ncbi:ribosomal protein S5 domain 2-like protein [Peniophora sp. CONT]|nr:ribosomal protein S5 domain 2-like protein [Peniophora sp. CONT]